MEEIPTVSESSDDSLPMFIWPLCGGTIFLILACIIYFKCKSKTPSRIPGKNKVYPYDFDIEDLGEDPNDKRRGSNLKGFKDSTLQSISRRGSEYPYDPRDRGSSLRGKDLN